MRMWNVFARRNARFTSASAIVFYIYCLSGALYQVEAKTSLTAAPAVTTAPVTPVQRSNKSQQETNSPQTPEERLNKLFTDLSRTHNASKAQRITNQINSIWSQSGSATIDLLIQWSDAAVLERRYPAALDFLNEAIALNPDYAEAWNRRATLYLIKNDYAHAMYDINRTLELEPRHYRALMSLATILRARGLKEQAIKAYEQVLNINPSMRDAQKNLIDLTDELADIKT